MAIYAGLDVSDKQTHICVVDADGAVVRRDVVASDPEVDGVPGRGVAWGLSHLSP